MILGENILTENDVRFKCSGRLPLQITVFLMRKIALYSPRRLVGRLLTSLKKICMLTHLTHFGTENREEQLK